MAADQTLARRTNQTRAKVHANVGTNARLSGERGSDLNCLYDAQLQRFPQHVNGCYFPVREADTYLFVGDVNSPKINCPDGHFRGLSEADLPARFLRRQVRVLCTFGVPGWPQRHHLADDRPARDYNTPGKS